MRTLRALLTIVPLTLAVLLSGCGRKGELEPPSAWKHPPAAPVEQQK